MEQIRLHDAQLDLGKLFERVARDQKPVTITKDGAPLVDIVPSHQAQIDPESRKRAQSIVDRLRESVPKMSREEIVALIHESRPQ